MIRSGTIVGFVQGGFVLDLHDSQSQSLVVAIVTVGVMGLAAAALITLLVTGGALGPIRRDSPPNDGSSRTRPTSFGHQPR